MGTFRSTEMASRQCLQWGLHLATSGYFLLAIDRRLHKEHGFTCGRRLWIMKVCTLHEIGIDEEG